MEKFNLIHLKNVHFEIVFYMLGCLMFGVLGNQFTIDQLSLKHMEIYVIYKNISNHNTNDKFNNN